MPVIDRTSPSRLTISILLTSRIVLKKMTTNAIFVHLLVFK